MDVTLAARCAYVFRLSSSVSPYSSFAFRTSQATTFARPGTVGRSTSAGQLVGGNSGRHGLVEYRRSTSHRQHSYRGGSETDDSARHDHQGQFWRHQCAGGRHAQCTRLRRPADHFYVDSGRLRRWGHQRQWHSRRSRPGQLGFDSVHIHQHRQCAGLCGCALWRLVLGGRDLRQRWAIDAQPQYGPGKQRQRRADRRRQPDADDQRLPAQQRRRGQHGSGVQSEHPRGDGREQQHQRSGRGRRDHDEQRLLG